MNATVLNQGMTILLLTGWCLITTGVGRYCLSHTSMRFALRNEHHFLSFGIGLVVIGYAVFLLGTIQSLNNIGITSLLAILGLLPFRGGARRSPVSRHRLLYSRLGIVRWYFSLGWFFWRAFSWF